MANQEPDNSNFAVRIRHKKCSVVGRIRQQMSDAQKKYENVDEPSCFCWRNSCCFLVIFTILLMAWFCIIYGAVIGAALCSNVKEGSFVPIFRIPGLNWPNKEDVKVWKVF